MGTASFYVEVMSVQLWASPAGTASRRQYPSRTRAAPGGPRGRLARRASAVLVLLCATLAAGCALPSLGSGPNWQQRRLILVPGVCMSVDQLPRPPALPPGLPQLPADPHLPDWLTCGSNGQPVNVRDRALATFGTLVAALGHAPRGQQVFTSADLRFYSYDAHAPNSYDPAATRQPLDASAAALEQEFASWHRQEPRATFDIVGHSLGAVVALLWAAKYATPDELRYVHAIVTLDGPVSGYPDALFSYLEPYLVPLFGTVARSLAASVADIQSIARAPTLWSHGAGHSVNAVFDLGNVQDIIVPAFVATLAGADGLIDDFGTGPDALNHGAVLRSASALSEIAGVLQTTDGPQLAAGT
jgi:pimeloyl-ACP methyl ester carboxylesterase